MRTFSICSIRLRIDNYRLDCSVDRPVNLSDFILTLNNANLLNKIVLSTGEMKRKMLNSLQDISADIKMTVQENVSRSLHRDI
jgi:hypothetical protein